MYINKPGYNKWGIKHSWFPYLDPETGEFLLDHYTPLEMKERLLNPKKFWKRGESFLFSGQLNLNWRAGGHHRYHIKVGSKWVYVRSDLSKTSRHRTRITVAKLKEVLLRCYWREAKCDAWKKYVEPRGWRKRGGWRPLPKDWKKEYQL